jgi:hypothetical protein
MGGWPRAKTAFHSPKVHQYPGKALINGGAIPELSELYE